jgi:transposase-like protein
MSVAGIAMANDINPNQLQRWIRECRADDLGLSARNSPTLKLVPLAVRSTASWSDSMIEITLSGKKRSASLRWPVSSVASLAALLRDVLA